MEEWAQGLLAYIDILVDNKKKKKKRQILKKVKSEIGKDQICEKDCRSVKKFVLSDS